MIILILFSYIVTLYFQIFSLPFEYEILKRIFKPIYLKLLWMEIYEYSPIIDGLLLDCGESTFVFLLT